jgi:hypothetical protein
MSATNNSRNHVRLPYGLSMAQWLREFQSMCNVVSKIAYDLTSSFELMAGAAATVNDFLAQIQQKANEEVSDDCRRETNSNTE